MKNLVLLFALILAIQITVAQPPEYFVGTWYLHSFTFIDQTVSISDLEITEGPTLIIKDDFTLYGSSFCNNYNGTYEYIDSDPLGVHDNFIPRNIVRETENCGDLEDMENYFFIPFVQEKTADIYVLNAPGEDKWMVLQYAYPYGYQEYKDYPALEISDYSIKNLIVFPNPVQNILNLQSATNDFKAVSITDLNGRIIRSTKELVSNEIDVSALKPGMYFINIQSSEGSVTKKFIKN